MSRLTALVGPERGTFARAARHLRVNQRTLWAVSQGWRNVPPSYVAKLEEVEAAQASSDEDVRREACFRVIAPLLDRAADAAIAGGWAISDVEQAVAAWSALRLVRTVEPD